MQHGDSLDLTFKEDIVLHFANCWLRTAELHHLHIAQVCSHEEVFNQSSERSTAVESGQMTQETYRLYDFNQCLLRALTLTLCCWLTLGGKAKFWWC